MWKNKYQLKIFFSYVFVLWTKVLLAMMHHILVQPLLNLHFNVLIIFVKYGQHFTVNPNLRKMMDSLKHQHSIFIDTNLDATLRVGKTSQYIKLLELEH
jgi:hypothetical protein